MLSSPEVFIEGDHDYGDDLMMDMACWLCNHLLPDIGYQIVITFRKFDEEDDSPAQGFHLSFDKDNFVEWEDSDEFEDIVLGWIKDDTDKIISICELHVSELKAENKEELFFSN